MAAAQRGAGAQLGVVLRLEAEALDNLKVREDKETRIEHERNQAILIKHISSTREQKEEQSCFLEEKGQ